MAKVPSPERAQEVKKSITTWINFFQEKFLPAFEKAETFEDVDNHTIALCKGFFMDRPFSSELEPAQAKQLQTLVSLAIHRLGLHGCNENNFLIIGFGKALVELQSIKPEARTQNVREKINGALSEQAQATVFKLSINRKVQFKRAKGGLEVAKENIEALDPDQPQNKLDDEVKKFAAQFSGTLVLLTNECLDFKTLAEPEIVEYFKALVSEIVHHSNYAIVKDNLWHQVFLSGKEGGFVKFLKLVK